VTLDIDEKYFQTNLAEVLYAEILFAKEIQELLLWHGVSGMM